MEKITWEARCFRCGRAIHAGKPTLLFSTREPSLAGVSHSTCSYSMYRNELAPFHMRPPEYLSEEDVSFLMHFFPKLYSLPGGEEPNWELRCSIARVLRDFPASLRDPMASLREFLADHARSPRKWLYEGDLETDFLRTLGGIHKAAKEKPVPVVIDFRPTPRL